MLCPIVRVRFLRGSVHGAQDRCAFLLLFVGAMLHVTYLPTAVTPAVGLWCNIEVNRPDFTGRCFVGCVGGSRHPLLGRRYVTCHKAKPAYAAETNMLEHAM